MTNDYFYKLNFVKPTLEFNLEDLKGNCAFEYGKIFQYSLLKDTSIISKIIPIDTFKIKPTEIYYVSLIGSAPPHIDNKVNCCINYYIDSCNCTTKWWERKPDSTVLKSKRFDPKTKKVVEVEQKFHEKDLILKDQFTAQDGEFFLLNINKIHSVVSPTFRSKRTMIQLSWGSTPFDTIVKSLENFIH